MEGNILVLYRWLYKTYCPGFQALFCHKKYPSFEYFQACAASGPQKISSLLILILCDKIVATGLRVDVCHAQKMNPLLSVGSSFALLSLLLNFLNWV